MRVGIVERVLSAVAERAGLQLGQTYTIAAGAVVAVVLAVFGLPPVLDDDGIVSASAEAPATTPTTVPAPVTPGPIPVTDDLAPADEAAPPTSVGFRPPPPAPRSAPTPTTTTTTTPGPRPPIPTTPAGTTSRFAAVPAPGAPDGVGIGPDGTVYVATNNASGRGGEGPSEIIAFRSDGTLLGSFPITGQADGRTNGLTGLAVDDRGRVIVADASTHRLLRLDPSRSELVELAKIPDLTPCLVTAEGPCEPGATDNAPELRGLTLDADGSVLVADRGQGIVWRFAGGDPMIAVAVAQRAPGEGPTGVAVRGDEIIVAVSGTATPVPTDQSAVVSYLDGTATVLATYPRAEGLAGVAVGASGRIFVTLAGANAVAVIGPDGPVTRYDGGGVTPAFDAPTGITIGDGFLLTTNQSTVADDPTHWAVHRITVNDRPSSTT